MSAVGQCWDNAPVESLFGRLKCELASGEAFATRGQARAAIFEYREAFYNRVRRHSARGFLSPLSSSGRTTRPTINFAPTFLGEDRAPVPLLLKVRCEPVDESV